MNKNILVPTGLALMIAAGFAQAQTAVTIYGRLDLGVHYSTNMTPNGSGLTEVASGAASSSRWGVRGTEDLGGGLKALFTLEGGINPDTGTVAQSGRLFGRQSTVGLGGSFGTVNIGRQNSLAYDIEAANEPFGWANLFEDGFIYDNYTSKRWDNSIRYSGKFGAVSTGLMYAFGEQAASSSAFRNVGASIGYGDGPLDINAAYQETRNRLGTPDHKVIILGGSYQFTGVKFFLDYMNHRSDITPQKNDIWATGVIVPVGEKMDLIGGYYHDRQSSVDGAKKSLAGMVNYKLSKRSNVYLQADYTKIDDGYTTNVFDDQGYKFPTSIRHRGTITAGLRHQF